MREFSGYFIKTAILIWAAIFFSESAYAESLYVFYPSTTRTLIMQKKLSRALPGINVRVFGRYRDFSIKTKRAPPDAILSKVQVINLLKRYSIKLNGSRRGKIYESYVFLSVDNKMNLAGMRGKKIGVFDILGRKGMDRFVGKYFPKHQRRIKLKRVSKIEDLLPLLIFNMADAALIPKTYVNYFKDISKLHLVTTPVPKMQVGIIALAVKDWNNAPLILRRFSMMDHKTKQLLGIDSWKLQ